MSTSVQGLRTSQGHWPVKAGRDVVRQNHGQPTAACCPEVYQVS